MESGGDFEFELKNFPLQVPIKIVTAVEDTREFTMFLSDMDYWCRLSPDDGEKWKEMHEDTLGVELIAKVQGEVRNFRPMLVLTTDIATGAQKYFYCLQEKLSLKGAQKMAKFCQCSSCVGGFFMHASGCDCCQGCLWSETPSRWQYKRARTFLREKEKQSSTQQPSTICQIL